MRNAWFLEASKLLGESWFDRKQTLPVARSSIACDSVGNPLRRTLFFVSARPSAVSDYVRIKGTSPSLGSGTAACVDTWWDMPVVLHLITMAAFFGPTVSG